MGANLDGGAKRVDSSKPLHHIYKEDNKYYSNKEFFWQNFNFLNFYLTSEKYQRYKCPSPHFIYK